MSFLNAATESRAKHLETASPKYPPKTRLLWARLHHRLALFWRIKEMELVIGVVVGWRSGGHVAASPSACTPRKRTMNQKVGATVGNTAGQESFGH